MTLKRHIPNDKLGDPDTSASVTLRDPSLQHLLPGTIFCESTYVSLQGKLVPLRIQGALCRGHEAVRAFYAPTAAFPYQLVSFTDYLNISTIFLSLWAFLVWLNQRDK